MIIHSGIKQYEVHLTETFGFMRRLLRGEARYWVIDRKVYELYEDSLFHEVQEDRLMLIDAEEENKTLETAMQICERMTTLSSKRNSELISIGGGIIQDITGFAANILYRGIAWTFIPTTLLAACDSCIGGKTSLNYKKNKNLLGTFYPPDHIYICPQFFHTLTEADYKSGLGEVVKFNIMYGMSGLERLEENMEALLCREEKVVNQFVRSSLDFKKQYIEEDEYDKGIRIHLNYGHTFGHAFETVSGYKIPHGTAVAMGTIVANHISQERGILNAVTVKRMEQPLLPLLNMQEISFDMDEMIAAIRKDKKQINENLTCVLLDDAMKLQIVHDLTRCEIETSIEHLRKRLKEYQR